MGDILYLGGALPWASHVWILYDRHAVGVRIDGDEHVPRARWWTRAFIRWAAVKYVAVIEPTAATLLRGDYSIGVARTGSPPKLYTKRLRELRLAIPLYREACTVFCTNPAGSEERMLKPTAKRQTLDSAIADGIFVLEI